MAILRSNVDSLIPQDATRDIIQGAAEASTVLTLGRRLPDMTTKQRRLPVLESLPLAYFVDGDTGWKQTTTMNWDNKFIEAEEIAVIVPVPEAVLDDSEYDLFAQIRPQIIDAFGRVIDGAILHGRNKPASWPDGIVTTATQTGNVVATGTNGDLYDDIMGENGVIARVEEDGFIVDGHVGSVQMRSRLRGLRDTTGQPLFSRSMQDGQNYALDGNPIYFPMNGAFDTDAATLVSGDFDNLVYAIRQDMTYKLLTEATLHDPSDGSVLYNLAQQDMVALRCVMRLGWQVPNPMNSLNPDGGSRFPFAALTPAAPEEPEEPTV